jgi:hypothetical protein
MLEARPESVGRIDRNIDGQDWYSRRVFLPMYRGFDMFSQLAYSLQ